MIKLLKRMRRREALMALLCAVLVVAQVYFDLKLPDYMTRLTTLIKTPGSVTADILSVGGEMLLCTLARKPEILIFDDSFSALDYKTDAVLREGLAKELPGTTKIIVAQRISTIRNADQILVLDRGEIAGLGTHDELMASCGVYREIAMSQLSEEELKKGGASK